MVATRPLPRGIPPGVLAWYYICLRCRNRSKKENIPHEEVFRVCRIFWSNIESLIDEDNLSNEIRNAVWAKRVHWVIWKIRLTASETGRFQPFLWFISFRLKEMNKLSRHFPKMTSHIKNLGIPYIFSQINLGIPTKSRIFARAKSFKKNVRYGTNWKNIQTQDLQSDA